MKRLTIDKNLKRYLFYIGSNSNEIYFAKAYKEYKANGTPLPKDIKKFYGDKNTFAGKGPWGYKMNDNIFYVFGIDTLINMWGLNYYIMQKA
jgi:hypothetical protein